MKKSPSKVIFKTKSNEIMFDRDFILKMRPKKSKHLRGILKTPIAHTSEKPKKRTIRETDRQRDRQTERQTGRQRDRQTDRQADRDRQTDRQTD